MDSEIEGLFTSAGGRQFRRIFISLLFKVLRLLFAQK
jgi:hypothetical protein